MAGWCVVSPLRGALADYLAVRRALGFKLVHHQRLLGQFVDYLEREGAALVSVEQAVAWATSPSGVSPSWWADRLSIVRGFAAYLHLLDPAHQVPPPDLLPPRQHRATPYLYSGDEIERLMSAAQVLTSGHRRATHRTLIGLLAATGMRIGEALALDRRDLGHDHRVLIVRHGKFGKSRELPLHPSTLAALARYLRRRDRPHAATPAVFVSTTGSRLPYYEVQRTFRLLARCAGLAPRSSKCRPRLHDLRHSFAVHTILDAYRDDAEVGARLPLLSTYLGHVDPKATYWYLSAAPELLELAARRLERHLEEQR